MVDGFRGGGFCNNGGAPVGIVEEGGFITFANSRPPRDDGGAVPLSNDDGLNSSIINFNDAHRDRGAAIEDHNNSGQLLKVVPNQGQLQHGHHQQFNTASLFSLYGACGQLQLQRRQRRGGVASNPCRDCGNQAKKDCAHLRCRSCCKSHGFQCQTHMRSTWVSATQRRERDRASSLQVPKSKRAHVLSLTATQSEGNYNNNSSDSMANRLGSDPDLPPNLLLGYGQDIRSMGKRFPLEVRTTTRFKCVKISALAKDCNVESEYAYKTTIKIRDHIFKGVLYDQGYSSLTSSDHHHEQGSDKGDEGWPFSNINNTIGMSQGGFLIGEKMGQEVSRLVFGSSIDHESNG